MEKIDIKIKQLQKQEFKNLQASQLIIELTGKNANYVLTNTLRRLSYDYIPTYAFPSELIKIEKNTSVYNNDYMKCRLSQITIPNLINNIYYLPDEYWLNINYNDPSRIKHPDDNKVLEFYINVTNNTNENMNVTTEHMKVYEDGVELKNKFDDKFQHLIIDLRPNENFSCKCVGALGIGKVNSIWSAAGNSYYDEIDEHKFKLTIESQGQMNEYDILYRSCYVIEEKIKIIKKLIEDKYDSPSIKNTNTLKIILENEDHTIGGLINDLLQENKNIAFSGLSKPNLLLDKIIIEIMSIKNDPIKPLIDTLDYIIDLFQEIKSQIMDIGGIGSNSKKKSKKK